MAPMKTLYRCAILFALAFTPLTGCGTDPLEYDGNPDVLDLDAHSETDGGLTDTDTSDAAIIRRDTGGRDDRDDVEGRDTSDDIDPSDGVDSSDAATELIREPDTSEVGDVSPDAPAVAETVFFELSGRVTYDDRVYDEGGFTGAIESLPARGVTVHLLYPGETILAETITLPDGSFGFSTSAARIDGGIMAVRALAESRYLAAEVRTVDRRDGANYGIRAEYGVPDETVARDDINLHASATTSIGGAMNIVDAVWGAWDTMPELAAIASPPLVFAWQAGLSYSCGSCYSNNRVSLGGGLDDPDEYDDDIILHEFGHFFVVHFSRDSSPGGPHRDRIVEPTLAYGEGLAYFLVGMFRDNPLIIDNFEGSRRLVDMEAVTVEGGSSVGLTGTSNGQITGSLREEIVAGVLWDLFDEADEAEPFDTIAMGRQAMLALLRSMRTAPLPNVGVRGIDLADLLNAATCRDDIRFSEAVELTDDVEFPWSEEDAVTCSAKGNRVTQIVPDIAALLHGVRDTVRRTDRGRSTVEYVLQAR